MKYLLPTLAFLFVLPAAASACVCDTSATVQQAFTESAAVFTGKFIGSELRKGIKNEFAEMNARDTGKQLDYEVMTYRFEVADWFKGNNSASEVILVTDEVRYADGTESTSDCGLGFKAGESYLVYAYGDKDGIAANACSRTARLSRAKPDIAILKRLTSKKRS
jgi:hypothetical protein